MRCGRTLSIILGLACLGPGCAVKDMRRLRSSSVADGATPLDQNPPSGDEALAVAPSPKNGSKSSLERERLARLRRLAEAERATPAMGWATKNSIALQPQSALELAVAQPAGAAGGAVADPCAKVTYDQSGSYAVLDPAPDEVIYTSEHFAVRWKAADKIPLSDQDVQSVLTDMESMWTKFIDEIGFEPPYANQSTKYKVSIYVGNDAIAAGSGVNDHDPALWMFHGGLIDRVTLAHEFAHTLQFAGRGLRESPYVGWLWESHAEWMAYQMYPFDLGCSDQLSATSHLHYGSSRMRYCNWHFFEYLKDKYCYRVINDLWSRSLRPENPGFVTEDPFRVLMRNMNWSIDQLNDELAQWALRNTTWDYAKLGATMRERYGSYHSTEGWRRSRITRLEEIERTPEQRSDARRYAVPAYWAPQRWGYNLVRLYPVKDKPATRVTINFRGLVQTAPNLKKFGTYEGQPPTVPQPNSGWRFGFMALEANGKRRYGSIAKAPRGTLTFPVKADDQEVWLMVMGAPTVFQPIFFDQVYYSLYRYPWMVEIIGAQPEGYQPGFDPRPRSDLRRHPNGGGWVGPDASVAPTAYVGRHAAVYEGEVKDRAMIMDFANVTGGIVEGDAKVGQLSLIDWGMKLSGQAKMYSAWPSLLNQLVADGPVQMRGDTEMAGRLSKGIFYGFACCDMLNDPAWGADRVNPEREVTRSFPKKWLP